jgi:hypothetical protein
MRSLVGKAKWVFLVMLIVYVASTGAGWLAGKSKIVDFQALRNSRLVQANSTLEYRVPGYGDLLQSYKSWHRPTLSRLFMNRNAWGLALLVFFNNFVMANLTMFIRSLALLPLILYPYARFVQGVALAQTAAGTRMLPILLAEFGGYFLVITATLCLWAWALRPRAFGFTSRKEAIGKGLKFVGAVWLVSGIFMALGAFFEVRFLLGIIK